METEVETGRGAPRPWAHRAALAAIRFYQGAISPLLPPSCPFHPTCSHYTYESIERFGLMRGALLGALRLCRCYPFQRGGFDPVPEKFTLSRRRRADSEVSE